MEPLSAAPVMCAYRIFSASLQPEESGDCDRRADGPAGGFLLCPQMTTGRRDSKSQFQRQLNLSRIANSAA